MYGYVFISACVCDVATGQAKSGGGGIFSPGQRIVVGLLQRTIKIPLIFLLGKIK